MRDRHHLAMLASAAAFALTLNHNTLAAEGETAAAETAAPVAAEAPATAAQPSTTAATTEATPDVAPVEAVAPPASPASVEPPPAEEVAVSVEPTADSSPAGAPPADASPSAPGSTDSAKQRVDARRADAMVQRGLRYQELRERAAAAGVELPETPPWKQTESPAMPAMPAMPEGMMTAEERAAHVEKMRNMTPEDRMAMREAQWADMRERAAERGIEMPETPPWKAAMERRQAVEARWEAYRKLIDEMSDEQREAAKAVFGRSPKARGAARGPAGFGGQPFPGVAAQGGAGHPAMPRGGFGPCGSMPCQGARGYDMAPARGPMMYPQRGPAGMQQGPMPRMYGNY